MKKIKQVSFWILCFLSANFSSQILLQTFVENKGAEILGVYEKNFNSNNNIKYFASANLSYTFGYKDLSYEFYNNLNFKLVENWGVSLGANLTKNDISPLLGLAFAKEYRDFGINFFPSINYSFQGKDIGYGLYTLMEYTPKITENLYFYSMLIMESNFDFNKHNSSNQIIRLGIQTSKKLQFGLGTNIFQSGEKFETNTNLGIFFGKQF